MGNTKVWDFEFEYNRFIVRNKARDISLDINAKVSPIEIRGNFYIDGNGFQVSPNIIEVKGLEGASFVGIQTQAVNVNTADMSLNFMGYTTIGF